MKSWNYALLKQQAKDLEEVANHFFSTIPDTDEWEDALSDFITQAGLFHIYVENVLEDERYYME
jgi:hypothetical protein